VLKCSQSFSKANVGSPTHFSRAIIRGPISLSKTAREFQYIVENKEFKICNFIQNKFNQKEIRNQTAVNLAGCFKTSIVLVIQQQIGNSA